MLIPNLKGLALWAAGALILVGLGAGMVWYAMADRLAAAKAEIRTLNSDLQRATEQRATDRATLASLAKKNAATARETASLRQRLDHSLFKNPEWAAQPVPKEVQDALRQP